MVNQMDIPAFTSAVKAVLSSEPPFLDGATPDTLDLLTQLLDKPFLNGEGNASAWDALAAISPLAVSNPFDLLTFVTKRDGSVPSPELSSILVQLIKKAAASPEDVGQILDDHSICLSCTIPTEQGVAAQVTVTPHTIELVPASELLVTEGEGWWKLPWSSTEKVKKTPQTVIAKKMLRLGDDVKPYVDAFATLRSALLAIQNNIPAAIAALPGVAQLKALIPLISMICSFGAGQRLKAMTKAAPVEPLPVSVFSEHLEGELEGTEVVKADGTSQDREEAEGAMDPPQALEALISVEDAESPAKVEEGDVETIPAPVKGHGIGHIFHFRKGGKVAAAK
ncbi:hypothetical protein RQP46_009209 [Phenoliferia psychrophenolica]